MFLSSHDLDEVQRITDRIAVIKEGRIVAEDTVDGLRRTAPKKVEVVFRHPVDPARLGQVAGVTVTSADGPRIKLEATGDIGPVLRLIASLDPVDLTSRPADLDELFLTFYLQPAAQEVATAR